MLSRLDTRDLHLVGALGAPTTKMIGSKEYLVVPVVALMEGVIHAVNAETPEFVPFETLQKAASTWNGCPVTLGHPKRNGTQCSANDPGILDSHGIGIIANARVDASSKKMLMDAMIEKSKAKKLHPDMYERLAQGETEEVSVGALVASDHKPGKYGPKPYVGSWLMAKGDHLAFLPGGRGACSVEMGCGTYRAAMRVCADRLEDLSEAELVALDNPEGHNQYTGGGGSAKLKTDIAHHDRMSAHHAKEAINAKKNGDVAMAQSHDRAAKSHTTRTENLRASLRGAEGLEVLSNPEGINQYSGSGGTFSVHSEGNKHTVSYEHPGEKPVAMAVHTNKSEVHDHAAALSRGNHRSHEGMNGSPTPQEGDRVTIAPAYGGGRGTVVATTSSGFHEVKTSKGFQIHSSSHLQRIGSGTHRALAEGKDLENNMPPIIDPKMKAAEAAGDAEEQAEMIAYQTMRNIWDALDPQWDQVSKTIDDLIAAEKDPTETPEEEDAEEQVETASIESIRTILQGMVGAISGLISLTYGAALSDQPRYGAERDLAGARHNVADTKAIQAVHDHSMALGATCDRSNYKQLERNIKEVPSKLDAANLNDPTRRYIEKVKAGAQ